MLKKRLTVLLAFVILLNVLSGTHVFADEEKVDTLNVNAKSALLMEPITGKIIYEKNAHEKLKPASVTKIMTILMVYESVANGLFGWEDEVVVSEHAASMGGSQVFLEEGEVQTVATMLKCIVVSSANDAAVAMAEKIAGSEEAFGNEMNDKAKELGMNDTHFVNASGLDEDNHYTSAYDIALMSRELTVKYPEIFELSGIWMDTIIHSTRRGEEEFGLTNTNKLLQWYNGATGLKTGSTSQAKYCLSGTATRNDLDLIAVVMAAPDYKTRFNEVMRMFDYGFSVCKKYSDPIKEGLHEEAEIKKGVEEKVGLKATDDFNIILTDKNINTEEIEKKIVVMEEIVAPVEEGQVLGEVKYYYGDTELGKVDLVAEKAIGKVNFMHYLMKIIENYIVVRE